MNICGRLFIIVCFEANEACISFVHASSGMASLNVGQQHLLLFLPYSGSPVPIAGRWAFVFCEAELLSEHFVSCELSRVSFFRGLH
jgi:hypothetical protein